MSKAGKGVQGQLLEVNVVGCKNLSDKEWFGRQDPYVIVEYSNNRFRTRTDTDGGKNPTYNEKFQIPLIEGLRELNVQVWDSNVVALDKHIGSAKVLLEKVLSTGYDNTPWQLRSKIGRTAGEVNLILHFAGAGKKDQYAAGHSGYPQTYPTGYPAATAPPAYGAPSAYPPAPAAYPPAPYPVQPAYPSAPQGYPPVNSYTTGPTAYPTPPPPAPYPAPAGYPPPPQAGYPPAAYPTAAPSPYPYPAPGGYPPAAQYPYPGGHKAGKVHVGHSSYGSHGHYKHGKHKKHKGYKFGKKFGKKFKGWGKGWKGKKK